jgi:hypothetical protein
MFHCIDCGREPMHCVCVSASPIVMHGEPVDGARRLKLALEVADQRSIALEKLKILAADLIDALRSERIATAETDHAIDALRALLKELE